MVSNVQKRRSGTSKYTKASYQNGKLLKTPTIQRKAKNLGIPSLEYRRLWTDVIEVYKIVNQIDHIPVDKFFKINDEISTRSNGLKLFKMVVLMCSQIEL